MAFQWLNKLRDRVLEATRPPVETGPPVPGTVEGRSEPPGPQATTWLQMLAAAIPLFMFVIGILLAAFTELVRLWAILGYLLIVTAPIVYWLRRIDARLVELQKHLRHR